RGRVYIVGWFFPWLIAHPRAGVYSWLVFPVADRAPAPTQLALGFSKIRKPDNRTSHRTIASKRRLTKRGCDRLSIQKPDNCVSHSQPTPNYDSLKRDTYHH
ncbi:MAG: hypothetical protein P5674_23185, partial [Limnospira sp. PMC 289.06]|nr:hypothetical protein [Limnospira sp. PMC 289.06]MDT9313285.1 hypothetical protein [Limnospira sp. Paracas R14]